jgi:FkbM family methyltransferase
MTTTTADAELDELLAEGPDAVATREAELLERVEQLVRGPVVLFGAGALGRYTLAGLRRAGAPPVAFADNDRRRWGTQVEGLPVLSATDARERFGPRAVFVVTIYTGARVRQDLRRLGLRVLPFAHLALKYPGVLLPHNCVDWPHQACAQADEIRRGLDVWADEASRREYVAQVRYRLHLDGDLPPCLPPDETYFPEDLFRCTADEVFVDCGAYDGDSVRAFLGRRGPSFGRVIALEPDPHNCARLRDYIAGLPAVVRGKVEVRQLAAGARRERVRFAADGTVGAAFAGEGPAEVDCAPLDEVLSEQPPTFIKMDIEGAEPEALAGARRTLARHAPVLAVCLYHRQEHLWQIPTSLRSASDRYRLFLRRYSDDCWEQVCYAVPAERLGH